MSKLSILIPQYNEDNATIKPLLDSIQMQRNVNFKKDIEVYIGNDGSDVKLDIEFLKTYTFPIQYHYFEHGRLAATRKKLFDVSGGDYVMFCDADDLFINSIALSMILQLIDNGFDALTCDFIEEHLLDDDKVAYVPHENDSVFVHGKVYRREFLLENKIEWHEELREHQDSAFNVLARTCSKNSLQLNTPIYMWHDNKNSISRKNKKFHSVNTWCAMIDSYNALIEDLKDRGYGAEASYYAKYCLYATYYEMSHEQWKQDEAVEQKAKTMNYLAKFYDKHELLINRCGEEATNKMNEVTKQVALKRGALTAMPPFEEWLNSIKIIFRGGDLL